MVRKYSHKTHHGWMKRSVDRNTMPRQILSEFFTLLCYCIYVPLWKICFCASAFRGPRSRCVKLRVVHAPGMPETFSPPPTSKETHSYRSRYASRHVRHARAVNHVGFANPRWRGKRSRHSRRMRNPQLCVSSKRFIKIEYIWNQCQPKCKTTNQDVKLFNAFRAPSFLGIPFVLNQVIVVLRVMDCLVWIVILLSLFTSGVEGKTGLNVHYTLYF